jgi:hypothetical protein
MEIVVSIFDRFKAKSSVPQGLAAVKVQFTVDENEAINRTLERYATVANSSRSAARQPALHRAF